jgi:hypothetical protein
MRLARLLGVELIGVGLVCMAAKGTVATELVRKLVLALFVVDTIGLVVTLWGQLAGVLSALGWFKVLVGLFLTLGLGYFSLLELLMQQQSVSTASGPYHS